MHLKDRGYLLVPLALALAVALDAGLNGSALTIFLVRKLFDLVQYVEFWR